VDYVFLLSSTEEMDLVDGEVGQSGRDEEAQSVGVIDEVRAYL
jgi:hypothetical protein